MLTATAAAVSGAARILWSVCGWSTGGKASSGKYDSDLLPVFAILFSAAGLFIVTYLFVHYTAKGIEAGIRKAKQYAAERRAREAAVRAAEAETARIAAIPESVRNIERVAAGLRSVRTERPKRHAIR